MIYQSADKTLNCIKDVYHGTVNDVYICEDISSRLRNYYTLWVVHNHDTARKLLEIFENLIPGERRAFIESFSSQDDFCVVLDYREDRRLSQFYMGTVLSLYECESVCANLIMECLSCGLPYPVLYLVLTQHQLHMAKDQTIYFSYRLDLEQLDERKGESDCAIACAQVLLKLLEPKKREKAVSYKILAMKTPKKCYPGFSELYRDVKLAAVSPAKVKLKKRIAAYVRQNEGRIFRLLLLFCLIFGTAALLMIITQLIWGDMPFYRLFINPFKTIGTESLLQ